MYTRRPQKKKKHRGLYITLAFIIIAGASYVGWALFRPLPDLEPLQATNEIQIEAGQSQLTWPASGQAAVGVVGDEGFEFHGSQGSAPTASTAKIITALVVLDKHPLNKDESGPTIPITAVDEQRYRDYLAKDGSVTVVKAGTSLTERQMLEAIMLPSANNIADSLVVWAFGSMSAYQQAATSYLRKHNLNQTRVGSDASGLAPNSLSTASDLVLLGKLVMQHPVLADIVGQTQVANFPVAGTIQNVNYLLGQNGIVGIKTGNSDQAGGAFVGAARVNVHGKTKTIVTAVLASPNKPQAMRDSQALIRSAATNFTSSVLITKGEVVGAYTVPWGGTINAIAKQDLEQIAWRGQPQAATTKLSPVPAIASGGSRAGSITGSDGQVEAVLTSSVPKPTLQWRLTHPWQ